MGKYSVIGYACFLLFMLLVFVAGMSYMEETTAEFESIRLATVVNNATDSAVREAVTNENITLDQTIITPKFASDTFFRIFMQSYGMSVTEENKVKTYEYTPLLALVCNDGVFIGYPRVIDNGRYDFRWEPKQAYIYDTNPADPETGFIINMTINGYARSRYNKSTGVYTDVKTEFNQPANSNKLIDDIIHKALEEGLSKATDMNSTWTSKFFIPAEMSNYSVVDFHGTTMLALVQGVDINQPKKLTYFSIGGTQTTRADKVVCYVEGGKRFYCYASNLPTGHGLTILKIYDTVWEAAENGYMPDLKRLK